MNLDRMEHELLEIIYFFKNKYPDHNQRPGIEAILNPLWDAHKALGKLQDKEADEQ